MKSLLRQSLILTTIEASTISDEGEKKPVRLSLAIVTSQSHINENISSNIYAISSAANPFERTEPQV